MESSSIVRATFGDMQLPVTDSLDLLVVLADPESRVSLGEVL